jgi:hypothetical protein
MYEEIYGAQSYRLLQGWLATMVGRPGARRRPGQSGSPRREARKEASERGDHGD